MPSFINYIKIDFYKFYHSKIIKVHFIIPVLAMIPFLSYYSVSPWNELDKVISSIQIISMSFPLIISIILNMVYEQEECGGFQYFLTTPNKKYLPHFSKLISIIILGLVSTLIAILGFGIMFYIMGNDSIEISFYYKETLIVFSSNILLYMIQYLVVFYFGKGASIGIGIIGSLISALMLTGLGDGIWQVIPWAYSMRLSSYFILYKENILIQNSEIIQGIFIMIIFIAITFISQLIFSNHWEGNRENY